MKTLTQLDEIQQTRNCEKLLAAVVAVAISDACVEPFRVTSKDKTTYMRVETVTAFRFLFSQSMSGLDAFALWLDFNEHNFRRKLLQYMADESRLSVHGKDPNQRRNFRYNYRLWEKLIASGESFEVDAPIKDEDKNDRLGRRAVEIKLFG